MFIKEVELFHGIPSHIIDEIAKFVIEENFLAGHFLFQEGDFAEFLYILEEGAIDIVIHGQEGKRISFLLDKTGLVFGWSALIEPNRYTASAECVKESRVIKIDGERLLRTFERYPAHGMTIIKRLAGIIADRLMKCYHEIIAIKK